ncbi:hypothetical protein D3C75_729110 [compost metagenome]
MCNGHDIDVGAGKSGEELGRNATQRAHAVTDDRDNCQMLHDRQRFKQTFFQLKIKLIFHRTTRTGAICLRHAIADAVFRR